MNATHQEKRKINKKDKSSHHKQNYLVVFGCSGIDGLKALINASDKTQALRIGLNKYCRTYPGKEITRARVAGVYPAGVRTIEKRID